MKHSGMADEAFSNTRLVEDDKEGALMGEDPLDDPRQMN